MDVRDRHGVLPCGSLGTCIQNNSFLFVTVLSTEGPWARPLGPVLWSWSHGPGPVGRAHGPGPMGPAHGPGPMGPAHGPGPMGPSEIVLI